MMTSLSLLQHVLSYGEEGSLMGAYYLVGYSVDSLVSFSKLASDSSNLTLTLHDITAATMTTQASFQRTIRIILGLSKKEIPRITMESRRIMKCHFLKEHADTIV